jgi:hypothetical protein
LIAADKHHAWVREAWAHLEPPAGDPAAGAARHLTAEMRTRWETAMVTSVES